MVVKPFYLDDLTSLNKPNLLSNLLTIPLDKEVELNIKVKVPPLYITGEPELVCRQHSRLRKNALLAQTITDILIYLQTNQFKESC